MSLTLPLVSLLFGSSGQRDVLTSSLFGLSGQQSNPAESLLNLKLAQANETREIAAKRKDPLIARELKAFEDKVRSATTPEEVLDDYFARRVLLTANGLGEQADSVALAKKALIADLSDPDALPYKLSATNKAWLATAQTYDFAAGGLSVLQRDDTIEALKDAYAEVRWQEDLEARSPGLSFALAFIDRASSIDSAIGVLGDAVAREVITGAYGIPKEIAFQSIVTQEAAITRKIDVARLQDPKFVEDVARRYLIAKAGSNAAGSFAVSVT
jgi:hypothetical protein